MVKGQECTKEKLILGSTVSFHKLPGKKGGNSAKNGCSASLAGKVVLPSRKNKKKRSLLCALQMSSSGSSGFSVPKVLSCQKPLLTSRSVLIPPKLFIELVLIVFQCIYVLWVDVLKHFLSNRINHSQLSHLLSRFTYCCHFQKPGHRS